MGNGLGPVRLRAYIQHDAVKGRDGVQLRLIEHGGDYHCMFTGKTVGGGKADAGPGTGHQGDLVGKLHDGSDGL